MKPTEKATHFDELITSLTGIDRRGVIQNNKCAFDCESPNMNFRNQLAIDEYKMSGMCQNCQDQIFDED